MADQAYAAAGGKSLKDTGQMMTRHKRKGALLSFVSRIMFGSTNSLGQLKGDDQRIRLPPCERQDHCEFVAPP